VSYTQVVAILVMGGILHGCALHMNVQPSQGQSQAQLEEDVKSCTSSDAQVVPGIGGTVELTLGGAAIGAGAGLLSDAGMWSWWNDAGSGTWIGAAAGAFLGITIGSGIALKKYLDQRESAERSASSCLTDKGYVVVP
jgi:hypothetical protein